ncbi:MAG: TIR domain-containing protein [Pseudomonadales bacterium]|nr:TIR domain-containing protein [Pseudomonadales bacterium]
MDSKLTVFVCSTYSDLSDERGGVLDAIRRLQLEHDSMEFFGARANQPIETCLAEVRRSNILVVIVGHRYGSIVPDMDISYSEAEYQEGFRLNKPCLVYIRGEEVPILPKLMERDPDKLRLLEDWKSTLQTRHTVASFEGKNDLSVQVAADLGRTIRDLDEAERAREEAHTDSPIHLMAELQSLVSNALEKGLSEEILLSSIRRVVSVAVSDVEHLAETVFLSYAHSDREIVRKVADGLEASGIKVWFDESSLKPGSQWVLEIERALDAADFIIFFISPSSVGSGWAKQELQVAMSRQVSSPGGPRILPVLLEKAEVPPLLRSIQWLDMTDGDADKAVANMVKAIRHFTEKKANV